MITTVRHNVGDDFVRDGLAYLLEQHFKDRSLRFENVHKHAPITARYRFENWRSRMASTALDAMPLSISKDRILGADLVVQCGAPVYWCHGLRPGAHCANNEWYGPLIRRRFSRNKRAKLLNLAAGTCQKYDSDGTEFCNKCLRYAAEFFHKAKVTTVRDQLARKVLHSIDLDAPLIACSSIFATDRHHASSEIAEYVALNFMETGAHYTLGQKINKHRWKHEFTRFYSEIRKYEEVAFICHNATEIKEARQIAADARVLFSEDYADYIRFYSRAKFGIVNRVHGALAIASFGRPAVVIGNDSRATMVSEIGLKSFFVNDVDFDVLMAQYEYLRRGADNFADRFRNLKRSAYESYMQALSTVR